MIKVVVAPTYERARLALHNQHPDANPYQVRYITNSSGAAALRGSMFNADEILWAPGWQDMDGAREIQSYLRILTRG